MYCEKEFFDYDKSRIKTIRWMVSETNHRLHRENDLPAEIHFFDNKNNTQIQNLKKVIWFRNGKVSRENGPAIVEYYEYENNKRQVKREEWFIDDVRHREHNESSNKPALIEYFKNGKVKAEAWYIHGYHTKGIESPQNESLKNTSDLCLNLSICCLFFK